MSFLTDFVGKLKSVASEHSEQLAFVDQPWLQIQENLEVHQTYYFKKGGDLLVIESDGNTKVGRWEMLANIDAVVIHYADIHLTLKRHFMDRAIMVFFKGEEPYLFINENKRDEASLTIQGYLDGYLKSREEEIDLEEEEEEEEDLEGYLWLGFFVILMLAVLSFVWS